MLQTNLLINEPVSAKMMLPAGDKVALNNWDNSDQCNLFVQSTKTSSTRKVIRTCV